MERTGRDVEDRLAAEIGRRPGSVLIYAPPAKMNMKAASVKVHWKGHDMTLSKINDPGGQTATRDAAQIP